MSDDENDNYLPCPERIKKLGFKPQKENILNHLLPYSDQLDQESEHLFKEIKYNLAKAVMLREMKPACGVWTSRLIKYLRIYGFKFSKEDHINLVKLLYELLLTPDLEPCKLHKFATLFIMLTKKKHLLSPEDLTLPWRPLYDLNIKLFEKSATRIGMYRYLPEPKQDTGLLSVLRNTLQSYGIIMPVLNDQDNIGNYKSLESSFIGLVRCAKPYFPLEATKEILTELMPYISPWSTESQDVVETLAIFLPLSVPPSHQDQGHQLWFNELMALYNSCYDSPADFEELMKLFAGLAKRNPGSVDWTPYVPHMFTRFLRALNLPVNYKDTNTCKYQPMDIKHMATWIIWSITPNGLVMKHLKSFMGALESYLHTANSGVWSFKLRDLLRKLAREFLIRTRRERGKVFQKTWELKSPEAFKLRDEDITEFVQIMLQPTLLAVHSRTGAVDVSAALQHLATLRPAIVVPPLIEKLKTSLGSLTEPHRVTVAMQAVAAVARPMVRGAAADYPEGPTHVVPLLLAALPGLDPNDNRKTLVTLHFIMIFGWMVPFIDCSTAYEHWKDLTEEELLTCESTAQFEDFILVYFERLFAIVESNILENARHETRDLDSLKSKAESVVESAISSTTAAILMQCSPKIFGEALRKFKKFATDSTYETNVAGSMVGVLARVFARVNPEATLAAFVPQLCEELNQLLTEETLTEENTPRDVVYRLLLLSNVLDCHNGTVSIKYMTQIESVLDKALTLQAKQAYAKACDVLSRLMISISTTVIHECRSSNKDYSKAPQEWLPIREWGKGISPKEMKVSWYVPSETEIACAQRLLDKYGVTEIENLKSFMVDEKDVDRKKRLKSLCILHAVLSGMNLLPVPEEEPIELIESKVPASTFRLISGIDGQLTLNGSNARVELSFLILQLQKHMLAQKSDDTQSFDLIIKLWERVSGIRPTFTVANLEARIRACAALERALDGRGGPPGGGRLRSFTADAVNMLNDMRIDVQIDAGIGPTGLRVLMGLFELSVNTYTTVRVPAQVRLYWMLSHNAYSYRALLPGLSELLLAGGEGEEWHAKHKGALYVMLGPRSGPLISKQDWLVMKTLWPAILKAPLSEKPSLIRLEHAFVDALHQFPTVNIGIEMTDSSREVAGSILPQSMLEDEDFKKDVEASKQREKNQYDETERTYLDFINELVEVCEAPNVQWRRLELALHMLSYCPSLQVRYPPKAVKLIVNSLIHDDINVRKIAVRLTLFALKQIKKETVKIKVDPYEVAGVPRPEKRICGFRKDLEWAMWSRERAPKTDEEWEKPSLPNSLIGFYCWPEQLEVAAPSYEQARLDRTPAAMEESERHIWEFFEDKTKLKKFVDLFTAEEKKGKEKFSGFRFAMFTLLFKVFGEGITLKLLKEARRHASLEQDASQRFACEVVAAAIKAPKRWDRGRALAVYAEAIEVLRNGFSAVTPDMKEEWGTAVASAFANLDPLRGSCVLEAMLDMCAPASTDTEDPSADSKSSFGICARLYALQGALSAMTWRAAPLASEILQRLMDAKYIQHPYQNVRERIGSMLMTIFNTSLKLPDGDSGPGPRFDVFIRDVKEKLKPLYDENDEIIVKSSVAMMPASDSDSDRAASLPGSPEPELASAPDNLVTVGAVARLSPDVAVPHTSHELDKKVKVAPGGRNEKELVARLEAGLRLGGDSLDCSHKEQARSINLLSTVTHGSVCLIVRGVQTNVRDHYVLLSTTCALSARGPPQPHDELGKASDTFLACLALAHHDADAFEVALQQVVAVSRCRSWWTRLNCVHFAQTLLFYGLPLLCASRQRALLAERLALDLMLDPRLEVRQAAAKLLTGLMHCSALVDEEETLRKLTKLSRTKDLIKRHCGVLGLCAYMSSRPYGLGPKIGVVLAELSRHTNGPDPIPQAIRSALADFKRTHQDDWPTHRAALTEEELDLLADLTSPPAYCA